VGTAPVVGRRGVDGLSNARAGAIEETPSFADAFERRRCLVLADGAPSGPTGATTGSLSNNRPFAMVGTREMGARPPTGRTGEFGTGCAEMAALLESTPS
jgi:hypothetical protein